MRKTIMLLILLTLCGCASSYDNVKIKAGIDIPNPIIPIDFGITIELKEALDEPETITDEELFERLVGNGLLDSWLNQPDSMRVTGPDGGQRGTDNVERPEVSGGSGGTSG